MPTKTIILHNDEDEEYEVEVPARWEICSKCEGEGHHSNPAVDGNGITQSEWAEWDYDERERYMSGFYDVNCSECQCSGKCLVVDGEAFKKMNPRDFAAWIKLEEDRAEYDMMADSEARWERRMLYGSDY